MKDKKKSHGVQLLIRAIVRNPDGKVITDTGLKPAKSFVFAFLSFLYDVFEYTQSFPPDIDGVAHYMYSGGVAASNFFKCGAGVNNDEYGIVIGTGETPEDNEDHALDNQLTEGVGAGNITHGAMVIGTTAVVGANVDLELKRAFTNLTGSTITVKEAGVLVSQIVSTPDYFHLIIRDVLAASVDVPDNCSLTVYYTFRTTV